MPYDQDVKNENFNRVFDNLRSMISNFKKASIKDYVKNIQGAVKTELKEKLSRYIHLYIHTYKHAYIPSLMG